MLNKTYKKNVALIGIGYWGKVHLKYLKKFKKNRLKTIVYLKKKNFIDKKILSKYIVTNNLNSVLNDKSIEYIDIVTPIHTHSKLALKFLKKKKKVFIEKPLLMKKSEQVAFELLLKKNNKFIVSYPYLFSKTLNRAKKIISSGKVGKINYIEINFQQCGRFMKYGVNHLLGTHALSILSLFFNIRSMNFEKKNIIKNQNKVETSVISCFKKSKIICNINLSINYASDKSKKEIKLFCEKGTIMCDLNSRVKNLIAYKYYKKKFKDYKIAKVIKIASEKFDEKNNMKYSLENFFNHKGVEKNFILTKNINRILK